MSTTTIKALKNKKSKYPEYLSLDELDSVIKSGADPMEMIASMKKALLERVTETELDHHLTHEKGKETIDGNYRNGYGSKTIRMDDGEIEIATPRDRNGSFEPQLIPKRSRSFKGFDDKIISMYGLGMSTRDIQSHLKEMYNIEVSHELIAMLW